MAPYPLRGIMEWGGLSGGITFLIPRLHAGAPAGHCSHKGARGYRSLFGAESAGTFSWESLVTLWLLFDRVHKCRAAALGGRGARTAIPASKDRRGRRSHIQVLLLNLSFFHNSAQVRGAPLREVGSPLCPWLGACEAFAYTAVTQIGSRLRSPTRLLGQV